MHFNARSLVNKIDAVTNLINDLAFDFTAIAVTETWANLDNESGLNIQGYNYFGRPRAGRRGGGVAIYIKDNLNCSIRDDLNVCLNDDFEFLCVQVKHHRICNNIVVVYRPPSGCLQSFNDSYNSLLNKLCTGNDKFETYIAGDFNINLLNYETHNDTNTFLNTAFEHHLYPIITRPTRFSNTNTTLIDNIFTNNPGNNYYAGLLLTDLSDHLPIFLCL
jgi:exonuclease III